MRPSLFPGTSQETDGATATSDDAPLSGRLTCPNPKCEANVGKFAWQGLQCSCGKWVVPAIGVARARVDINERKGNAPGSSGNSGSKLGAMGIRLPPHMRGLGVSPDNEDQTRRNNNL